MLIGVATEILQVGWGFSPKVFSANFERLFNFAAGFGRADDTLPARLLHEPVPAGPCRGQIVDLPPMLDEYYVARGWDEEGRPSTAKLAKLGLTDLAATA